MEGLVLSGVGEVLFTEWKGWYCQGLVKSCLLSGRVGLYVTSLFCSWYGPLPSPSCDDLGGTCISLLEEGLLLVVSVVEVV